MSARIPAVEAANHRNPARIRRPDTKDCAFFPVARGEMRAHALVKAEIAALVEQVEILVREQSGGPRSGGNESLRHPSY